MRVIRPIVLALAASLLAPLAAFGLNDGYHGTTDTGGLIAVRVDYDRKEQPIRVHSLRWANIPVSCGTSSSATSGDVKLTMKVDSRGAFEGSAKPDIGDAGGARRQLPAGDRAVALVGMLAVVLAVAQVVEQVAGAGHRAEGGEGDRGVHERAALVQASREQDPGEDEQVLDPLLRAQGPDQRRHMTAKG